MPMELQEHKGRGRRGAQSMWALRKRDREGEPLSRREFERLVEKRTRYYFNMSVPEFRAALREGKLDENLAATDIALLLGETPG